MHYLYSVGVQFIQARLNVQFIRKRGNTQQSRAENYTTVFNIIQVINQNLRSTVGTRSCRTIAIPFALFEISKGLLVIPHITNPPIPRTSTGFFASYPFHLENQNIQTLNFSITPVVLFPIALI